NGEPVSASDSLLTGNLTGNFSNLGLFLRFLLIINEQIQMLASKFPSKWNREFFRRNRELFLPNREFSRPNRELGIRIPEQGIWRPPGNPTRRDFVGRLLIFSLRF